jgi:hypothetical protein
MGKMQMNDSVFVEFGFVVLVVVSIVLPVAIYAYMMWKNALSRMPKSGLTCSPNERCAPRYIGSDGSGLEVPG